MDEIKRQYLLEAGIDVEDALERFMGNETLMVKFLLRFPEDENFLRLKRALAAGDAGAAFTAAHTLKGVAGNLSMEKLFRQVDPLVEDLRSEHLAAATGRMPALEESYARVLEALGHLS